MKRLILIIIAALAIHVGIQAQAPAEPAIQVGDSVMVNPDTTHYMTGEEISPWVYTVKHAIQQVGSAFYPDGVLLQGIISWLHQSASSPTHLQEYGPGKPHILLCKESCINPPACHPQSHYYHIPKDLPHDNRGLWPKRGE